MDELKKIYKMYPLNMKEVAEASNVHRVRVQQFIEELEKENLALFVGNVWRLKYGAIEWMRNRPNRRR